MRLLLKRHGPCYPSPTPKYQYLTIPKPYKYVHIYISVRIILKIHSKTRPTRYKKKKILHNSNNKNMLIPINLTYFTHSITTNKFVLKWQYMYNTLY